MSAFSISKRFVYAIALIAFYSAGSSAADEPPSAESVLLDSDASTEMFEESDPLVPWLDVAVTEISRS